MIRYYFESQYEAVGYSDELFSALLDEVAAALFSLDGGQGASFSGSPRQSSMVFGLMVDAADLDEASAKGTDITNEAISLVCGDSWEGNITPVRKLVCVEALMKDEN